MFITTGAQNILANPSYQSAKFMQAFIGQPLPRMANSPFLVLKGFFICGLLAAVAFIIVNNKISGNWARRGIIFGFMHWLLMVPWFEFYLPYNVMHEPMLLVLFEGLLWLVTLLLTGLYMSFVLNFRKPDNKLPKVVKVARGFTQPDFINEGQ
jgi:hypothetical protein